MINSKLKKKKFLSNLFLHFRNCYKFRSFYNYYFILVCSQHRKRNWSLKFSLKVNHYYWLKKQNFIICAKYSFFLFIRIIEKYIIHVKSEYFNLIIIERSYEEIKALYDIVTIEPQLYYDLIDKRHRARYLAHFIAKQIGFICNE